MAYTVYKNKCTSCGSCEEACPVHAISLIDDIAEINKDLCEACGKCEAVCPADAIRYQ